MTFEEKRAWILALVSVAAYAVYVAIVGARLGSHPIGEVPYVAPLLWTVGGSIAAAILLGMVAALVLALVEADYFWIANVLYLGFVLSAVLGSIARIVAYRRGFHPW